jgi:hypothetical protein
MAKKKTTGIKIPKKVLGFKLSKGTRKDVGKLLHMLESSEARAIAVSAGSVALGLILEKAAERQGPIAYVARKAADLTQTHQ